MNKTLLSGAMAMTILICDCACAKTTKIRIKIGAQAVTATLFDNSTATDFLKLLPLTLKLSDYADTERISYLPRKLSVAGAPTGATPVAGDIAYYAPWGNLAIYHRGFAYSPGLVKIGKMDGPLPNLGSAGVLAATVELVDE